MVLLVILLWFWVLLALCVHFVIAVIVYRDAKKIRSSSFYISPALWASISFTLPILGMFIYWIMNYSILKVNKN